jgi:hypothetical protein
VEGGTQQGGPLLGEIHLKEGGGEGQRDG